MKIVRTIDKLQFQKKQYAIAHNKFIRKNTFS